MNSHYLNPTNPLSNSQNEVMITILNQFRVVEWLLTLLTSTLLFVRGKVKVKKKSETWKMQSSLQCWKLKFCSGSDYRQASIFWNKALRSRWHCTGLICLLCVHTCVKVHVSVSVAIGLCMWKCECSLFVWVFVFERVCVSLCVRVRACVCVCVKGISNQSPRVGVQRGTFLSVSCPVNRPSIFDIICSCC